MIEAFRRRSAEVWLQIPITPLTKSPGARYTVRASRNVDSSHPTGDALPASPRAASVIPMARQAPAGSMLAGRSNHRAAAGKGELASCPSLSLYACAMIRPTFL